MKNFQALIGALLIAFCLLGSFKLVLDTPVVVRGIDGLCLKVLTPNPADNCSNLPRRYLERP